MTSIGLDLLQLDLLRTVKIGTVLLSAILAYLAYRAHDQKKSKGLLALSMGFAVISVGTALEGVLFEIFSYEILTANLVESATLMLALTSMVYAIYGVRD